MRAKLVKDEAGWLVLKINDINVITIDPNGKIYVDGWYIVYDESSAKSGRVHLKEIFEHHGVEFE